MITKSTKKKKREKRKKKEEEKENSIGQQYRSQYLFENT